MGSFANHMPLPDAAGSRRGMGVSLREESLVALAFSNSGSRGRCTRYCGVNGNTIVRKDLEAQALSVLQCEKILSETAEGESRAAEPAEARGALQIRLGLRLRCAQRSAT